MRVKEALNLLIDYFRKKSIENFKVDAEFLLAFVLKCKRLELFLNYERLLSDEQIGLLRHLSVRRAKHEPLQYILGQVDFYGQILKVDSRVLIPRPETEELVYQINQCLQNKECSLGLDLGTGSGAIAIALLALNLDLNMIAVDNSSSVLDLAYDNAVDNHVAKRLKFVKSSWFEKLEGMHFDFIVSNPPYLSENEVEFSQPEVSCYEPRSALIASDNGLSDLKHILEEAHRYLKPGGWVVLETGLGQHAALAKCAKKWGYTNIKSTLDLSHRERFFWAWIA